MEETFGIQLERFRLHNDLTQRGLAEKAGVSYVTICLIEKGKVKPKPLTAQKIAKALQRNIIIDKHNNITMY